jgi:hypothetical protein
MAVRKKKSSSPTRSTRVSPYRVEDGEATVGSEMIARIKGTADSYTPGDQAKPCAVLWTDPDRLWEEVLDDLKSIVPELFVYGTYSSRGRTGPAVWLRCVESRAVETKLSKDDVPIFYLPGVSKQKLREVEDCPPELQPLVEYQFRGVIWAHPNGKDWTPLAFLSSDHGGLGLDVAKDAATSNALLRALPQLLKEKVADLRKEKLDSDLFNQLLEPDPPSRILRWLNDSKKEKQARSKAEWKAFCERCEADYKFNPDKDGELAAAKLLGERKGEWAKVWIRFTEAPQRYLGVVSFLERIDPPKQLELGSDSESWPTINDKLESEIADVLKTLGQLRLDQAAPRVKELEGKYGHQRKWVWREIGRSQFAVALEYLNELATLVDIPLAAGSLNKLGDLYATTGWKVDSLVLKALDCCKSVEHEEPIKLSVQALYSNWLDQSARNLQSLKKSNPAGMNPRLGAVEATEGRIIIFADGLRYDVAQLLVESLQSGDLDVNVAWDWAPFPAVTATAKPFVSPVAALLKGGEAADEFTTTIAATGQRLTHDRFKSLLDGIGIQFLEGLATGDPTGKAWTEAGTLDKRGHDVGWKLAKIVDQEVKDLVVRVRGLIFAGWKEVLVVTDHGWLLMPGGFPKIELPKFLVDSRWGRCAAMKDTSTTDLPVVGWHWNPAITIASPPGIGCFKAGKEYDHGGISLQELVVPRILVRAAVGAVEIAKIADVKWVGLRCRVTIDRAVPGLKVDLRGRVAEAKSKVDGGMPKEVSEDGTVSLAVASPDDEGTAAYVVLLSNDEATVLDSQTTTIGGSA